MIVENNFAVPVWKPVDLTIKFETEIEFVEFKKMVKHCDTVPDAIMAYGTALNRALICSMMIQVYDNMEKIKF